MSLIQRPWKRGTGFGEQDRGTSITHCCTLDEARGRTVWPRAASPFGHRGYSLGSGLSFWSKASASLPVQAAILLGPAWLLCAAAALRSLRGWVWGFHHLEEVALAGGGPSGTEGITLSLPQVLPCPWQTSSLDTSLGASQAQFLWGWNPPPLGNAGLFGFSALLLPKCRWQITNASPRDE